MNSDILQQISLGMTREQVIAALGPPDDTGATSRKYPTPLIYKYGDIELHFKRPKTGGLVCAFTEDKNGDGVTLLGR